MGKKWVSRLILVIGAIVFLGSGIYLVRYFWQAQKAEGEMEALQEMKRTGESEEEKEEELSTPKGQRILPCYRRLYKKNSDLAGWITVEGTPIDYPVMCTKKDAEYYLHKNYEKQYDVNGLPFLDAKSDTEDKESNLMIYGHHMKSGMMFAHLLDYESVGFYQKHKTVQFDTLYEKREYEVVAAFYSQVYESDRDVFKYYNYPGHVSKKQYTYFVNNIKKLSLYDTGITPSYGEQLLMLVTCAYQTEEGRFVVVARRKD